MGNIAIIFAGGTGQRMNTKALPKQFLKVHGKPILVYTLEWFQNNTYIDDIIVVSLTDYIDYVNQLSKMYCLDKVRAVISGGASGQASIYNGLKKAIELRGSDNIVLIHDGVRPLISDDIISRCVICTQNFGNAITVSPAIETIFINSDKDYVGEILKRSDCMMAKAPQCFKLNEIMQCHEDAKINQLEFIDSASLMQHYGYKLYPVQGPSENIKITTPSDFYMFRALLDARESSQIIGL